MKQRVLSNFFTAILKLRQNLAYETVRYGINFNQRLTSNVPIVKYALASFFPSLFIIKAISKEDKSAQKVITEADKLYNDGQYEQLYHFLDSHETSDNPEILWRRARSIFEKVRDVKDEKEKLLFLEQALAHVDKALEINDHCWAAHKWKAILLDYVWRQKSIKGRIIHSFEVKKHMKRAIELNPQDGTNHYILGEWCYTFADMPWYQRKVAATIFASPPTSSYEEALQCFETAEKAQPFFYSLNLLMIAKCHLKLNNKEKAISFLKMVEEYPIKTPDDQKAHEEAQKLLKDLNV